MPAPIIDGLINRITSQLSVTVWDGEIPRQSTADEDITPESSNAELWPAIKVEMAESGMSRTWTTEDAYDDRGPITIVVWATEREQLEGTATAQGTLTDIEQLLAKDWDQIELGNAPNGDHYYVIDLELESWTSVQEKEVRTQMSQLLYRGELRYDARIHGMMPTR